VIKAITESYIPIIYSVINLPAVRKYCY